MHYENAPVVEVIGHRSRTLKTGSGPVKKKKNQIVKKYNILFILYYVTSRTRDETT